MSGGVARTMKQQNRKSDPLAPRLSMDEYASFVEVSLRDFEPRRAARQKELEERIRVPFRIEEKRTVTGWTVVLERGVPRASA